MVYNGIPISQPLSRRRELRRALDLPPDARIVGMVGTLFPIKGHLDFLEAAAKICRKHTDTHFVSIGDQAGVDLQKYVDRVMERRRVLRLEDRVHFMGHRSDARELVSGFDVKTVCTLPPGEGFGLVIIEAMAQAVPVISTNEGAVGEILTHDRDGLLVPSANPDAMAEAVDRLLCDEPTRRRIGEAGYQTCCERFDVRRTMREIEAVYDKLLEPQP